MKRDDADTGKIEIDFFERGLQLPEYNARLMRRTLPSTAYYRRFWIGEAANAHSVLNGATFYLTAETLYHGTTTNTLHFPLTTRLLKEKRAVAVEIDGLVRSPYNIESHHTVRASILKLAMMAWFLLRNSQWIIPALDRQGLASHEDVTSRSQKIFTGLRLNMTSNATAVGLSIMRII